MPPPLWQPIVPRPLDSREEADRLGVAAAEKTARRSPFEWMRWGMVWETRSHPLLPCDLLVGSRPHLGGWWPRLMLAAGHRGAQRYWQFDTYRGDDRHIPVELVPEAINTMIRVYEISSESSIWEMGQSPAAGAPG